MNKLMTDEIKKRKEFYEMDDDERSIRAKKNS